ncbi:MAG: hypothetical protein ACP5MD_00090 [Verrucomicrobiia bacterium]
MLRSFQGRVDARGPWQAAAADLLAVAELVMAVWGRFKAGEIDRDTMRLMLQPLQQAIWEQVERGRQQSNTFGSLCADLATRFPALWTFVDHEEVEVRRAVALPSGCSR